MTNQPPFFAELERRNVFARGGAVKKTQFNALD